jgi:4-hydroxy-3-methylbut-2-enyl diphosphate reductase
VEEIIDAFAARYEISVETVSAVEESMFFPLPRHLRDIDKAAGTAAE